MQKNLEDWNCQIFGIWQPFCTHSQVVEGSLVLPGRVGVERAQRGGRLVGGRLDIGRALAEQRREEASEGGTPKKESGTTQRQGCNRVADETTVVVCSSLLSSWSFIFQVYLP